jgi:hypothetical protein
MIDYGGNQWWNEEKSSNVKKRSQSSGGDSDLFAQELSRIEEALKNISNLIKKYVED